MTHNRADRVLKSYNLHILEITDCDGDSGYPANPSGNPELEPCHVIPERLRAFTNCHGVTDKAAGVHFYLDDFRFSGTWSFPERYIEMLRRFVCVLTPDFSVYVDMPEPLQRFNAFRNKAVGKIWQMAGLEVIPTLRWGFPESYDYCFDGLPIQSVVSLSTVGLLKDEEHIKLFQDGAAEAVKRLMPTTILAYGKTIDFDSGSSEVRWFEPETIARLRAISKGGE